MRCYKRLTIYEREEISRYLIMNCSYRRIAIYLNRSASTIQREIQCRKFDRFNYRATLAHCNAQEISRIPRKKLKLRTNKKLERIIVNYLHKRWSPEQIVKRIKILYPNDMTMRISHETIYAYIYVHPRKHLKRQLMYNLRRKRINRHVRDKDRRKSSSIQDYVSIDDRPPEIDSRKIAGHWEGDLILGAQNKSAIGTLVERKTRLTFIVKLKDRSANTVRKAFTKKLSHLPKALKKSLTYDQGSEMSEHRIFTENTKIQVYFAHPHSPWERGTSENTNSLIRDFFPRGTNFSKITSRQLKRVQDLLNDRPRKVLSFYTPLEIFTKSVALES